MNLKIKDKGKFSKKELLLISLICFMDSDEDINQLILKSAKTITNIPNLNRNMGHFAKGIILLLCDKFVKDELLNTEISNLVGGNMKIVEDYAQRKVDEVKADFEKELVAKDDELNAKNVELNAKDVELMNSKQQVVINLSNEGFSLKDIARIANVSLDFVNQTLSK